MPQADRWWDAAPVDEGDWWSAAPVANPKQEAIAQAIANDLGRPLTADERAGIGDEVNVAVRPDDFSNVVSHTDTRPAPLPIWQDPNLQFDGYTQTAPGVFVPAEPKPPLPEDAAFLDMLKHPKPALQHVAEDTSSTLGDALTPLLGPIAHAAAPYIAPLIAGAAEGVKTAEPGKAFVRGDTSMLASGLHTLGDFIDQTVGQSVRGVAGPLGLGESFSDPLKARELADQALAVEQEINKDRAEAQATSGPRPTLGEAMADPAKAGRILTRRAIESGAESSPAFMVALASRNPELASDLLAGTTGAQEYTDLRGEGVDRSRAAVAALGQAAAEKMGEDIGLPRVMGGDSITNALLAEGGQEALTQLAQQNIEDTALGRKTPISQQLGDAFEAALVGAGMGGSGHIGSVTIPGLLDRLRAASEPPARKEPPPSNEIAPELLRRGNADLATEARQARTRQALKTAADTLGVDPDALDTLITRNLPEETPQDHPAPKPTPPTRDIAEAKAQDQTAPAVAPPTGQPAPAPDGGSLIERPTENATEGNPVQELPVSDLALSQDVPQFKSGADETGVVEPLGGTFDRRGVGPVQVWRRQDGRLEVISGRHRLDLARRSGERTIPAQVYDESAGFDRRQAATLDAELNIRDGQGKVRDYVQYFQQPAFDGEQGRQAAESRGLLARATGRRAYTIASQGSPELIAAHSADRVTDEAAVQIAQAAPNNEALQNLGLKLVGEGRPITIAVNTMHAAKAIRGPKAENGDLFGFDDSAIQDAVKMAGVAAREQRALSERIAAIRGASKRPELARKEGVDVRDPVALERRLRELNTEKARWDNWSAHPDLVARAREDAGLQVSQKTGDLLPPATQAERVRAATEQKTAERNGLGRDLVRPEQGEGELLAGEKPAQAEVPPVLESTGAADPFYSALAQSVEAGKGAPKKGNAEQWRGWLDGAQRRGEIKQSERDWLGLDDWIKAQGTVTREQLAEYVRENQVQVQEVTLGVPGTVDLNGLPEGWETERQPNGEWFVLDQDGEVAGVGDTEADAITNSQDEDERADAIAGGSTKFASYQLPGGENYRELLLTLPQRESQPESLPVVQGEDGRYRVRTPTSSGRTTLDYPMSGYETQAEAQEHAARAGAKRGDKAANYYHSSHFDQPNILAHVRFNERTDADGARVLFLEEIQSDWHQAGRKKGYASSRNIRLDAAQLEAKAAKHAYDEWFNSIPVSEMAAKPLSELQGSPQAQRYARAKYELNLAEIESRQTVPNAPFKATDEWAMLAFKRMVRHAAENGFDKIAWTTGAQQAERYDLSKQVSQIRVIPGSANSSIPVGVRQVIITKSDGTDINLTVDSDGVVSAGPFNAAFNGKALDEIVGKDVAEKIMAAEKETGLRGENLKVGGEGMAAFYDKILPSAVNKWARRFGGRVGQSSIDRPMPKDGKPFLTNGDMDTGDFDVEKQPVHAITLTPAMREAALQGQPLFDQQNAQELSDAELTPSERALFQAQQDDVASRAARLSRQQGEQDADGRGLRPAVDKVVGEANVPIRYLRGNDGLRGLVTEGFIRQLEDQQTVRGKAMRTSGLYITAEQSADGKPFVALFTDILRTPELAAFTVGHEIGGHHGLRSMLGKDLDKALEIALQNPTVKAVADSMGERRKSSDRLLMAEEALADLAGAMHSGDWSTINDRHGVDVPPGIRSRVVAAIQNFLRRLKALFGKRGVGFSDAQVNTLLRDAFKAANNGNFDAGNASILEQTVTPITAARRYRAPQVRPVEGGEKATDPTMTAGIVERQARIDPTAALLLNGRDEVVGVLPVEAAANEVVAAVRDAGAEGAILYGPEAAGSRLNGVARALQDAGIHAFDIFTTGEGAPQSMVARGGMPGENRAVESSRDMFVPTRGDRAAQGADNERETGNGRQDNDSGQPGAAGVQPGRVGYRPDADAGTRERASLAIERLVRRFAGSTLADRLDRSYRLSRGAQLVGQRIGSEQDLAALAEVYRNPAFETLRYVFVDDTGNVLGETAVSMREPGISRAFPGAEGVDWLVKAAPKGATGVWLVHNHPSGDPTPSDADLNFTGSLNIRLGDTPGAPKLRGHVVLDHTVYGRIAPDGTARPIGKIAKATPDPTRSADADMSLLGRITSPSTTAAIGQRILSMQADNSVAVATVGAKLDVTTLTAIPADALATKRGAGFLSRMAKKSGGEYIVLLATPEVIAKHRSAISAIERTGIIGDLLEVADDGTARSLAAAGRIRSTPYRDRTMGRANARQALEVVESPLDSLDEAQPGEAFAPSDPPYVPVTDLPSRRPGESQRDYANRIKNRGGDELRTLKAEAAKMRKIGRANFRAMLAKQARMADVADAIFHEYRVLFDKADRNKLLDSIHQWETGQAVTDPDARNFFNIMDSLFADRIERLRAAKPEALKELVENYFPHIWEDTGKAGHWYAANTKRPLDGNKSFLKQRTWGTIREGMASGLRPVSYNPVDLALLKLGQMDKFITFHEFKNDLKARGWLKRVKAGERLPEGYALIDSPAFRGSHAFTIKGENGEPDTAASAHWNWAVPELIAKDVNNYLGPSLYRFGAWKSLRYLQNIIMSTRLGFSMFHAGFTTLDNAVTHGSIGLNRLLQGDVVGAIKEFAYIPVSPIVAPFEGGRIGKAWRGKVMADPHLQALLMALEEGGARRLQTSHQQDFNNALGSIARKLRRLQAPGAIRDTEAGIRALLAGPKSEAAKTAGKAAAKQAAELLGAVGELSSWLIHQKLVPAQKMNARVALLKFELDRFAGKLGKARGDYKGIIEAMHPDVLKQVAGRVVDNVDDRLGQMNYDNQFWNKTAREIAQALIGAVGWQVGTVRTVTGGIRDLQRIASPEPLVAPLDKAGNVTDAHMGRLTNRVTNLLVLGSLMSAASILTQLALTGDPPDEPEDYFFPKTGRKNADDSGERLQFPTYWMDHYKLAKHPLQTAGHKIHPSIGMALDVATNKDYYGTEVRDENADLATQIAQVAEYFAKGFIPYSITGQKKLTANDAGLGARVGNFFGFTVAPASVSRTEFQTFVADKAGDAAPQGARSLAQAERTQRMHAAEDAIRRGNAPDLSGLSERDIKTVRKTAKSLVPELRFKRLSLLDKLRAWDLATPEERDRYHLRAQIVGRDRSEQLSKLSPEDREYARTKLAEIRRNR